MPSMCKEIRGEGPYGASPAGRRLRPSSTNGGMCRRRHSLNKLKHPLNGALVSNIRAFILADGVDSITVQREVGLAFTRAQS